MTKIIAIIGLTGTLAAVALIVLGTVTHVVADLITGFVNTYTDR